MEYKTYRKITDNWHTIILGDPPIYYVQPYESYWSQITTYKISTDPDFTRYHVISDYMLHKHFTPALYNNIFMKVT